MPKERSKIKTARRITTLFLFSITSMYITYLIYHLTHVIYVEYAFYAFSLMTALLLVPLTFMIYALIGGNE
jgi:magnesium-transporting ATPase (P-type)